MTIKAIETTYGGCRFRSRLEARWAVLLDHLKIEWQYEAQGYEFNGRHYLPDFYLPLSKVHLEVKGGDDALHAEIGKLQEFVVAADTELVICGDIPNTSTTQWAPVFSAIRTEKGAPLDTSALLLQGAHGHVLATLAGHEPCTPTCLSTRHGVFGGIHPSKEIVNAYVAARSARFEHGQTPVRSQPVVVAPPSPPPAAIRLDLFDRVRHAKYGDGTVVRVQGEGQRTVVTIDFANETVRMMLIGGIPLQKLGNELEASR